MSKGTIPDLINGGVLVTATSIPAGVTNSFVPSPGFTVTGPLLYYSGSCNSHYDPQQINAFEAEMLNLASVMDPTGKWDLTKVTNLGTAFKDYAATINGAYLVGLASVTAISGSTFSVVTQAIQAMGYATAGDGGATSFKRVATVGTYTITAADGSIWKPMYETNPVLAAQFGVLPGASKNFATDAVTGVDMTANIQSAIDFAMRNGYSDVKLPPGSFKTTDTIHLGYGETFHTIRLIGGESVASPGNAGSFILSTAFDRPAINIQGGRYSGTKGIGVIGMNYATPNSLVFSLSLPSNENSWLAALLIPTGINPGGLQINSPYAGITVDAFSGPVPIDKYPNVSYPAWTGIGATQYGKNFTSGIIIEDCLIAGFAVGFANHPCQINAQGDYLSFRRNQVINCVYCISLSNDQGRNSLISDINFGFCHTFLTTSRFGLGHGKLGGPIVNCSGGQLYRIYHNITSGYAGNVSFTNMYVETCVMIGIAGIGGFFPGSIEFEHCEFQFNDISHGQLPGYLLSAAGNQPVKFSDCIFTNFSGLMNITDAKNVIMDSCSFVQGLASITTANGSVCNQKAINYTGGMLVPNADAISPNSYQGIAEWRGATVSSFLTAPTAVLSSQNLRNNIDFFGTIRAQITQGSTKFNDTAGNEWRIPGRPQSYSFSGADSVYSIAIPISYVADTMTFGYYSTAQGSSFSKISVGDIIYHNTYGTLFIVESVGAPAGGSVLITTKQQNNMKKANYLAATPYAFISNSNPDPSMTTGVIFVIKTGIIISKDIYFGDFLTGNATITNVAIDGTTGSGSAASFVAGDEIIPEYFQDSGRQWPIPGGLTNIISVTPGTKQIVLSQLASLTGRFPVSQIKISGG